MKEKEFVTISWTRADGVVRSSFTLPMADMLQASSVMAELSEIAKKIQVIQEIESDDPIIIPGLVGTA